MKNRNLLKILFISISLFLFLGISDPSFAQGWYNASWKYRKAITINSGQVPSTQSNFPILVSLASDAGLQAHARSDGYDITFTASNGTTVLPYQRESYNNTNGALVAWVNVSSIADGTVIYMYYGNSGATDQQQATSTWDANYKGVWHLKETPPAVMADGTSGSNNGTCGSSLVAGDQQAGKIDGSLHFGGASGDDVTIANEGNFDFERSNSFTISYWAKPTIPPTVKQCPVSKLSNTSPYPGYEVDHNVGSGSTYNASAMRLILVNRAVSTIHQIVAYRNGTKLNDGSWHHYVWTYNGNGLASGVTFYEDGASLGLTADADNLGSNSILNNTPVHFGSRENAGNWYNGLLDEVRISNNARSSDWIKTEYNNQSAPGSFYGVGTEQAITTTTADNKSVTYGDVSVSLTATVSPNPGGGTVQFYVGGSAVGSLVAVNPSTGIATLSYDPHSLTVNTYTIRADFSGNGGFLASSSDPGTNGTLTVNRANLTVTANNVNKTYGQTLTGGSGSIAFTPTGLQNGETIGSVTIAYGTGSAGNASVGTYTGSVTPSLATGGTFTASNYNITYSPGNIIVGAANLTITANNVNKTYGQTITGGSGSTAFAPTGLQNGEIIGSVTIDYGTGSAGNAAVATYTGSVMPSLATGGTFTAGNYNITYSPGNIIVGAANLTITANNVNKTYGQTLTGGSGSTAFTPTGLQNSETIGSVTIAYGTGAAASDPVGTYTGQVVASAATGGTFTAGNYTIGYTAGDIIVGAASSTTTADNKNTCYGSASVDLTATVSPNPGGGTADFFIDGSSVGSTAVVGGGIATKTYDPGGLSAGSHTIRADFSGYGNYLASSSTNATLTVNALPTFSVDPTNVSCYAGNDGKITVTVTSGPPPYLFSRNNGGTWFPEVDGVPTPQTDPTYTFEDLQANTPYPIRVKDGNDCVSPEIP